MRINYNITAPDVKTFERIDRIIKTYPKLVQEQIESAQENLIGLSIHMKELHSYKYNLPAPIDMMVAKEGMYIIHIGEITFFIKHRDKSLELTINMIE